MASLLSFFMNDDAFYYIQTARIFAHSGFSSFDGIHHTNGYQPLWFLVCVPVFWLFPQGGETPIRVLVALQVLASAGGLMVLTNALRRIWGSGLALLVAAGVFAVVYRLVTNGLESGLLVLAYSLVVADYLAIMKRSVDSVTPLQWARLGTLLGLLFLTRTDQFFVLVTVPTALVIRALKDKTGRAQLSPALLGLGVPMVVMVSGYLILNLAQTGHLMPVSGAVKLYFSDTRRAAEVQSSGLGDFTVTVRNLLWMIRAPKLSVLVSAVLIWPLVIIRWLGRERPSGLRAHPLDDLVHFWPFFAAATALWLFYGIRFFGDMTSTPWYYIPHAILLGITAGASLRLGLQRIWHRAISLRKPSAVHWLLRPSVNPGQPAGLRVGVALLVFLLTSGALSLRQFRTINQKPEGFNYHLYQGALWAREHTAKHTKIWSMSAGILGYFSERTVVNTDGLANSYDFLDNVLRPHRVEKYNQQWDLGIDCFTPTFLSELPPGCVVPLPAETLPPPFADPPYTRQLGVLRTHCP